MRIAATAGRTAATAARNEEKHLPGELNRSLLLVASNSPLGSANISFFFFYKERECVCELSLP